MTSRSRFELPKPQGLRQQGERDCSVPVFSALTGIPQDQIRTELPGAAEGKVSVEGWEVWLQKKWFKVTRHDGCPLDVLPCAHLVASVMYSKDDAHWVYRDPDGDVHDPSPVSMYMPADDERMRNLSIYSIKILTLSISR
jgi:hypothetical protein